MANLVPKFLVFGILAYVSVDLANAGQSVAKFFGVTQRSRANTQLFWCDKNKQELNFDIPLSIQQNAEDYYYLRAYTSANSVYAGIEIKDSANNKVNDVMVSSILATQSIKDICEFTYDREESAWFCKVAFRANPSSPLGREARYVYTYPTQNDSADFYVLNQGFDIIPSSNIGHIVGVGPNHMPNTLTAITASDNPIQDNVPLVFKIEKANPNLISLTLNFEFEDKNIANINGSQSGTCTIDKLIDQSGSCTTNITPEMVGKTKIHFLASSSWKDILGNDHNLNLNEYQPVVVNVGTLFAGYNTKMSPNRSLYRKGSTLKEMPDNEPVGSLIRGLAVDEPQHKLYVMTKNNTYRQSNAINNQLKLTYLAEIPGNEGQTLGLTDIPDRILVGSGEKQLYQIEDSNGGVSIKLISNLTNSIIHSALDPFDNVLYFTDNGGGITGYYSYFESSKISKVLSISKLIPELGEYNIAAYHGQVYAVGSVKMPQIGSKLFVWGNGVFNGKMNEVIVDENSNPFKPRIGGNKINSLFFTRQGQLYAAGNHGDLYKLEKLSANNAAWKYVASINSKKRINDSSVDNNGNIYLANDDGVWKVPFDEPTNSYRLDNYESNVQAIAIDNNRDAN